MSMSVRELCDYVAKQCNCYFPDNYVLGGGTFLPVISITLERVEFCFSHIRDLAYGEGRKATFHHLHLDQYTMFLYFLANTMWKLLPESTEICSKLILLNRVLGGFWVSYKAALPKVFGWSHPVGSVLGNAPYGEYFWIQQGITVSTAFNREENDGIDKPMGRFMVMSAGSQLINRQSIGDDVTLGVNVSIHNRAIASKTLVFRDEKGIIRERKNHLSPARKLFYIDD